MQAKERILHANNYMLLCKGTNKEHKQAY